MSGVSSEKVEAAAGSPSKKAYGSVCSVSPALNARQRASMYDLFLNLRPGNEAVLSLNTPLRSLYQQYHVFKSKDSHLAMSVVIVVVIMACVLSDLLGRSDILMADRGSSSGDGDGHGHPMEVASLVAASMSVLLFVASLVHRTCQTGRGARGCRRLCLAFAQSSAAGRLVKDSFIVFLTLFAGLTTVARVLHGGDCNAQYSRLYDVSGFEGECNSAAHVAMCLFVVLLPQVFCKGASRLAICLSW